MKKGLDYAKDQVEQFHKAFGHPVADEPTVIPETIAVARANWTAEELIEFLYATANNDTNKFEVMVSDLIESIVKTKGKILEKNEPVEDILVAQMDALTDINYFNQGSFVVAGVNPQPLFDIVQDANMAKIWPDGKPHFREEDGKVIKPEGWQPPEPKLLDEIQRQKMGE